MKAKDLRERTTEDLRELEASLASDRFQSRFKNFTNRLDDTSVIQKGKRDLARVKMILAERGRGVAPSAPTPEAEAAPKKKPAAVTPPPAEKVAKEEKAAAPKKEKAAKAEKPKAEKPKAEKPKAESKGKAAKKETE